MNIKDLAENLGLEEAEYLELLELFIETGMSDLEKLQSAISAGDSEQARGAAHSLKGAAGNIGLMELYDLAKEIEKKAIDGQLQTISEASNELKKKLESLTEFLQKG
ncbi:MAG: Hpt domain-containing protein [Desulfobacterales bacterium]